MQAVFFEMILSAHNTLFSNTRKGCIKLVQQAANATGLLITEVLPTKEHDDLVYYSNTTKGLHKIGTRINKL